MTGWLRPISRCQFNLLEHCSKETTSPGASWLLLIPKLPSPGRKGAWASMPMMGTSVSSALCFWEALATFLNNFQIRTTFSACLLVFSVSHKLQPRSGSVWATNSALKGRSGPCCLSNLSWSPCWSPHTPSEAIPNPLKWCKAHTWQGTEKGVTGEGRASLWRE